MNNQIQILIIDDNEKNRDLLRNLLSKKGFDIILAPNGKIALNLIKKNRPQLALINPVLQDVSGIEILEKIKILSPETERIAMIDFTDYDILKQVTSTNAATGFLEKPVDETRLAVLLDDILNRNKTQLETQRKLDDLFESYNQI